VAGASGFSSSCLGEIMRISVCSRLCLP
jgi:hypothetical protein